MFILSTIMETVLAQSPVAIRNNFADDQLNRLKTALAFGRITQSDFIQQRKQYLLLKQNPQTRESKTAGFYI